MGWNAFFIIPSPQTTISWAKNSSKCLLQFLRELKVFPLRKFCKEKDIWRCNFWWVRWVNHNFLSSVQSLSHVWLFVTPWIAAHQASLSITNSQSILKLMPIKSVMPSSHLILCRPLLLPPIPPSFRVFSNELTLCMRWPKYWSFSFSISPSNEHPGLIYYRMDRLDLLAVQGSLKSLLQHHSSKVSVFWPSAFFIVQLSHPYMTPIYYISSKIYLFLVLLFWILGTYITNGITIITINHVTFMT